MVITIAIVILALWFADILPLKVAEGMASFYMYKQEDTLNNCIIGCRGD